MQFKHYDLGGASVAADLVNEQRASRARYEQILREHRVDSPRMRASDAKVIGDWAECLRPAFDSSDLVRQQETVNALMLAADCRPCLRMHDGLTPHLHFSSAGAPASGRVRAMTSGGLAVAITTIGGERLGTCARPHCSAVFLDVSRSGRRQYCSIRCANAMRVAAHRARGKSARQ